MKLTAIVAIGIPGSGKSTALIPFAQQHGMTRVNRDDIRMEWFGHPYLQKEKDRVRAESDKRIQEALAQGHSVVVDATFTTPTTRTEATTMLRAAGAERILGIYFEVPLQTAQERNAKRDPAVPKEVLDAMYQNLAKHPPVTEEGFDALYTDLAELTKELV